MYGVRVFVENGHTIDSMFDVCYLKCLSLDNVCYLCRAACLVSGIACCSATVTLRPMNTSMGELHKMGVYSVGASTAL